MIGVLLPCSTLSNAQTLKGQCKTVQYLVHSKSDHFKAIGLALIEFNLQANKNFKTNNYFRAMVVSNFSNQGMDYSQIVTMIDDLKTDFNYTDKLLKMFKTYYGDDEQSLFLGFSSLQISAVSADKLSLYTMECQ